MQISPQAWYAFLTVRPALREHYSGVIISRLETSAHLSQNRQLSSIQWEALNCHTNAAHAKNNLPRPSASRTCQSRAAHLGCGREHIQCAAASTTNPCLSALHLTTPLKGLKRSSWGETRSLIQKTEALLRSTAAASLAHHPPLPACSHTRRRYSLRKTPRWQAAPDQRVNSRKPKWAERCRGMPRSRTHEEQRLLGVESSVTI